MIIENKKNKNNISQAPSSLTLNPRKNKLINKNQGMLSKYELSVPKDNTIYNLKNPNEIEKEEYGYELEQSYDNNVNLLKDNKNIMSSFTNDKSNGENIDNMNKYDSYLYKNIRKPKKKFPNNSDHGISTYNSISNKDGYIYFNMNNEEIDNEWINSKIKFDGVSSIASKVGSTGGNQSEYINNFLKNNINNKNNSSNMSKELKTDNNKIFKNFIQIIKNNDLNDLIDENSNFISDNKTIKKSIILQQVLINEMKKEIENLKNEKENMKKIYNSEKENIMNEYNKTINSILQENNKLNEIIKKQKNEIKNINKICREKIIELEQVNKMMESIKIDNGKNKNSTTENDNFDFDFPHIKEEISKNSIKDKNYIKLMKNQNIIKGKDLNERKTEESNNSKRDNNNEFIEKKLLNIIDNLYDTIKQISNNMNFFSDKLDDNSDIVIEKIKNIIEKININNNGYTDRNENISINDKIKTINEFNNIIKLEVNELLENFKNNIINYKISSYNKINKNNTHNISNLISSENGQNYFNEVKTKKYYTNNNLFKKIDIKRNKYKNNRILNELSDDDFSYSKKRLIKYNNKNKIINKSKDEIIFNKNDMIYNRTISLKSHLLEKNSVVYKSNVSPMSKEYYLNSSNNNENDKFNLSLNNLINKIIKNNGDENRIGNHFNKLKNIKLNSKVKEISDLINDNKTSKNNMTSFEVKNFKKSKIPIPEDGKINNTLNFFPTFNENKLSISNNNTHRNKINEETLRPIYKNSSEYFSANNCNTFASIPLISNYKTINHKKNTSMSSNYISNKNDRNKHLEFESIKTENRVIDNYMKMSNLFKSLNNSYLSSNTIESQMSKTKIETTPNKISNNSFSSLGNKNIYVRIENDENRFLPKIFLNKEKFKNNNNYDINGLTNDIMRPSFLKSNAALKLNNNKSEKKREKTIYSDYKK